VAHGKRQIGHAESREREAGTLQEVKTTGTIQTQMIMEQQNTETNQTDDLFIPNEDAESEKQLTQGCPKCGKEFKSKQALRMHDARVHTKKLGSGYKWKQGQGHNWDTSILEKQRLARRRAYQRKLRERYKLQGRDSRGYLRRKPVGRKWTAERLMKFQNTMRRKNREKAKRIQIVYPDPRQQDEKEAAQIIPTLRYCPACGEHLEGWKRQ
jgi:predicted RNA-binding Zn-ribbon protein involved in translation (DUF1610 family)